MRRRGGDAEEAAAPAPQATALQGTAAIGAPAANATVQLRCNGGSVLQTTTAANGTWQIDTTGQTLPCAVRVSGGNLPAGHSYHSVALSFGTVSVTPLTDLLLANVLGQAPALWWGSGGPTSWGAVTQQAVDQSLSRMRTALALSPLQTVDPRTAAFQAMAGNAIDDMLEALQAVLSTLPMDYATLLSSASASSFALSDAFRTGLQNAFQQLTTGTGTGTGLPPGAPATINSGTGNYTLVISVTASGIAVPDITITNVAKPANQQAFCSELTNTNSGLNVTQTVQGGSGIVTINSCSFDGTNARVTATLAITSPVALTVPYTINYSYR